MGKINIIYNSVTVNLPKNIAQLLLGAVVVSFFFGLADWPSLGLAVLGLALSYSSVYIYNDIIDRDEDAADVEKRAWKPLANGSLKINGAIGIYALLLMFGLAVSFMVNTIFGLMMLALLFLNFLHSAPPIRLKKRKFPTAINITVIEFLKYSSGWFALSSNFSRFPVFLMMMFAVIYTMGYLAYKFKFDGDMIKKNKPMFAVFGLIILALFFASLTLYTFPLALLILLLLSGVVFGLKYLFFPRHRSFNQMLLMEFLILPLIVGSFLLLSVPQLGSLNSQMVEYFKVLLALG